VADLAEHYGVSPSTVSVLRHRHFEAIPDHKRRLATKLGAVAEAAADRMAEKLANDEVSDRSLPVFAGVSIEKALMLLDQQSVTVVKHISVKEDSIADVLDRLPRANATAVD
jgi:DNA-binding MurR/RpiR family transcriptional regulator